MYLFMLTTGSRYITMSAIKLKDIKKVITLTNGNTIIEIQANRTKGTDNWKQPFNIEGSFNKIETMNLVYWLNLNDSSWLGFKKF